MSVAVVWVGFDFVRCGFVCFLWVVWFLSCFCVFICLCFELLGVFGLDSFYMLFWVVVELGVLLFCCLCVTCVGFYFIVLVCVCRCCLLVVCVWLGLVV